MATTALPSSVSRSASDVRNVLAGRGTAADKWTSTALALALFAAVAPLDISQLILLAVGATAYALLQPVAVNMPAAARPVVAVKPNTSVKAPRIQSAALAAAVGKYVPPALRSGREAAARPLVGDLWMRPAAPVARCPAGPPGPPGHAAVPAAAAAEPPRSATVKPVIAPTFWTSSWDAQVDELISDLLPTVAGDQALDMIASRVRRVLRRLVPVAEVLGLSSTASLRGRAFGVAVPDADIVVSCDPASLEKCLQTGSCRDTSAGTAADHRHLQKLALRAFTEKLIASGDFRFRRSAFASEEPKDPFEPRRNLGTTLTSCGLARFREELARAGSLLLVQEASPTQLLEPWAPEEKETRSSD